MKLTHFSLFSGIGGVDLAAEWAGFETVGQCEFADYPTKVLEKHWPDVPRWRDVRDVTTESIRERGVGEITLLSGGFPCQPHSVAGKRLASADDRDLWGEFARVIREVGPRWVLAENVPGLLTSESGRFFGRVLGDLAEMGFDVGWGVFSARSVGALHERERVFIVAHSDGERQKERDLPGLAARPGLCSWMGDEDMANASKITNVQAHSCACSIGDGRVTRNNAGWRGWEREQEPAWAVSKPELGRMANGVSNGLDALGCLGNAVVPQQVYPILQAIADLEET